MTDLEIIEEEPVILCTGSYDRVIRFWEAPTATCTKQLSMGETHVNCMEISPDKKYLVAGGNPVAKVFDIKSSSKDPVQTLEGHTNNIISLGFQKHSKWLFTTSEDGTVKVWDLRTSLCQRNISVHKNKKILLTCGVLYPNQIEIIIGDQSGTVSVWNLQENKIREQWKPEGKSIPIRSLAIAQDASVLCVATHRGICYSYKPTNEEDNDDEKSNTEDTKNNTKQSSKVDNSNKLVSSQPTLLKRESLLEQTTNGMFSLYHKWNAYSDAYVLKSLISPNCKYIVTSSSDGSIKMFDVFDDYRLYKTLKGHTGWVWDMAFSADSSFLISGSSDKTCRLWDLNSGKTIVEYSDHNKVVNCVALNDAS